jgi:hypothetical protein
MQNAQAAAETLFDVERLCADQPVALEEVVAEIVDINDGNHADANLDQRLCGGREVHQQYLFFPRRALDFGKRLYRSLSRGIAA